MLLLLSNKMKKQKMTNNESKRKIPSLTEEFVIIAPIKQANMPDDGIWYHYPIYAPIRKEGGRFGVVKFEKGYEVRERLSVDPSGSEGKCFEVSPISGEEGGLFMKPHYATNIEQTELIQKLYQSLHDSRDRYREKYEARGIGVVIFDELSGYSVADIKKFVL